ncbi:MAG: glycosyltransferase [Alistipes sp.]
MQSFSVCMSVYLNDKPADFVVAVRSIVQQTAPPDEIVLVVDGPVSAELEHIIIELQIEIPVLTVIRLSKNMGHAIARQTALEAAKNEIVAIMDSDDVAMPFRFERQLALLHEHPEISVVGGNITEFVDHINNVVGAREVPQNDGEIKAYMKMRCPMNLVTVMLRKADVQAVGGYIDWYCEEDYYLWIRLSLQGYKFYNIQEHLVHVRVGKEMYSRRGGWRYFKSEARLQTYMWRQRIISLPRFSFNVTGRFAIQVLMPNSVRGFVFQKLFRK